MQFKVPRTGLPDEDQSYKDDVNPNKDLKSHERIFDHHKMSTKTIFSKSVVGENIYQDNENSALTRIVNHNISIQNSSLLNNQNLAEKGYSKLNKQNVQMNYRESNNITFGGMTGKLKGSKVSTALDQSFQMAMS